MARVLVVGDIHLPAEDPDYYDFIKKVKRKYKTDECVLIGDVVDHNAISFHAKDPEAPSAMEEHAKIKQGIQKWKRLFPDACVCIGNHDERVHRLAKGAGIPPCYFKEYNELWNTKWFWDYTHNIDGVVYTHGTGRSGANAASTAASKQGQSFVMGHLHSSAGIEMHSTQYGKPVFGMQVGCGVDMNHVAMRYGKNFLKQPVLSAGVVIDGHPYLEFMEI